MQEILEQYGDNVDLNTVENALYCVFLLHLKEGEYEACAEIVDLLRGLRIV